MNIRDLLYQTSTNPLGNLLAAANLLMVVAPSFGISDLNSKFIYDLNRPAFLLSQALGGEFTAFLFVPPLVYLQWIVIAGFAKVLAARLRPPELFRPS